MPCRLGRIRRGGAKERRYSRSMTKGCERNEDIALCRVEERRSEDLALGRIRRRGAKERGGRIRSGNCDKELYLNLARLVLRVECLEGGTGLYGANSTSTQIYTYWKKKKKQQPLQQVSLQLSSLKGVN